MDTPQLRIIYQIAAATKKYTKVYKKREQHPEREEDRGVRGGGVGEVL